MSIHFPWKKQWETKSYTIVYDGNGGKLDGERFVRKEVEVRFVPQSKKKKSGEGLYAINPFVRSDLKCVGFYARKRTDKEWVWYGSDHCWHTSFEKTSYQKLLISEQTPLESLYSDAEDEIYLVAQWEDEQGVRRNCGYDIFSQRLMAHAFGGMDGKTYHNTPEAYEYGKKKGYQCFEIDLSYTEDDRLVLCHGWSESNCKCTGVKYRPEFAHMTYEKAMQIPIHGHSIIDARQFYDIVKNEPPYYYEIDFHNIKKGNEKRVSAMLDDFQHDEALLDRLLMQVYSQTMFEQIDSVYHFTNYMYLVGINIDKIDSILTYCLDHGICSVALRTNFVTRETVQKVHDAGLYAFSYTVNEDVAYANYLFDMGIDMICTDFLTEKDIQGTDARYGRFPFMVWYNSNHKDVIIHYEDAADKIEHLKSGNYEYKDDTIWQNDGHQKLKKCGYEVVGKKFAGWKMRVTIEGKMLWYSEDGLFHIDKDYTSKKRYQERIFKDGDTLPIFDVKKNMKLIMVAQWED